MKKSALALFVLAALFATACSSQAAVEETATDSTASGQPTDGAQEPAAPASDGEGQASGEENAPAPADVVVTTDPTPAPTVDTTSATALLGSDDWCAVASQIDETIEADDLDLLGDPVSLEAAYRNAAAIIDEAVRIAPPAIAPDVAQMAVTMGNFTALLEDADWDFLGIDLAAMDEAAAGMDISGYNIEKYNFDVCGIGEDPGDAPIVTLDEFDEPLPEGTPRDFMVESFVTSGFSEAEALCLVDAFGGNLEALGDPAAMFDAFDDCNISLDRLSQLGG